LLSLLESNSREIPSNWIAAKVGKLLDFQYGKGLLASERLDKGRVCVFGLNGIVGYCTEALTEAAAIIIGRKGSAGALNLCMGPSWTTDVAYFVNPPAFFDIHFLFIALQTLDLGSLGKGVKPGLSRSDAYELDIVVPPLAEQHRIVAKVNELIALCDQLEAQLTITQTNRRRLLEATLHQALAENP
jgi:type I restriction enzyme S subunit